MGKRYTQPSSYRDMKCPYCGLYFSPRGLNGHIRFKHLRKNLRDISKDQELIAWQEEAGFLLGHIETEEGLKEALRFFLTNYLCGIKPPK